MVFSTSGPAVTVLCRAERPRNRPRFSIQLTAAIRSADLNSEPPSSEVDLRGGRTQLPSPAQDSMPCGERFQFTKPSHSSEKCRLVDTTMQSPLPASGTVLHRTASRQGPCIRSGRSDVRSSAQRTHSGECGDARPTTFTRTPRLQTPLCARARCVPPLSPLRGTSTRRSTATNTRGACPCSTNEHVRGTSTEL